MNKVKLHSEIKIEVFGPNKIKDMSDKAVKLTKEQKIETVEPKWQTNKKNRVLIKKGQNIVPEECLEWSMVKTCLDKGIMTKGDVIKDSSSKSKPKPKPKTKPEPKKKDTEKEESLPKPE